VLVNSYFFFSEKCTEFTKMMCSICKLHAENLQFLVSNPGINNFNAIISLYLLIFPSLACTHEPSFGYFSMGQSPIWLCRSPHHCREEMTLSVTNVTSVDLIKIKRADLTPQSTGMRLVDSQCEFLELTCMNAPLLNTDFFRL